ncbi:MAG: dihydrofolate reductase family protein [Mycobacteriales bacterium]
MLREYGEIWMDIPKVLVSRTRTTAEHNTRIIGGDNDAIEQLAVLRRKTDGDIGIGGATLATQMLRAHLLDELLLFTHPVVLGAGPPSISGVMAGWSRRHAPWWAGAPRAVALHLSVLTVGIQ